MDLSHIREPNWLRVSGVEVIASLYTAGMAQPRSVNDWSVVETAQDFRTFLSVLSYDFARSPHGWRNRQLPDYFHAWARWLHATYLQPGATSRGEIDPPSWRGFAFQLHHARTGDGPPVAAAVQEVGSWLEVVTVDDFVGFLAWLGDDFRRDEAELAERARQGLWAAELDWTSKDIGSYLDTWAVWSATAFQPSDRTGLGVGMAAEPLDPLTWRSCAAQLYTASRYE